MMWKIPEIDKKHPAAADAVAVAVAVAAAAVAPSCRRRRPRRVKESAISGFF